MSGLVYVSVLGAEIADPFFCDKVVGKYSFTARARGVSHSGYSLRHCAVL